MKTYIRNVKKKINHNPKMKYLKYCTWPFTLVRYKAVKGNLKVPILMVKILEMIYAFSQSYKTIVTPRPCS